MSDRRIRVWDLPTRLFHWALLACIVGSLVSVKIGGDAVGWHFRFGYAILTLVLFRVIWGFVGSRYARFSSFPPNPLAAIGYLRGTAAHTPGHNPLGAFSVYGLLAVLALQVGTGLFANDDIMWDGPLKPLVSAATSELLTKVHRINRIVLLALIGLHLCAIGFYTFVKKERLVPPMLVGDRAYAAEHPELPPAADDSTGLRIKALVVLAISAGAVALLVNAAR